MKGKAVVFTNRNVVEVREVELPAMEDHEVLIDVLYSWISNGTEGSFLRGERIGGDTPYIEGGAWPFPIVAGYQKVGIVREVGAIVTTLKPGDLVFATISRINGMFDAYGGHVSPAVTAAHDVWKLPEGVDPIDYSGLVLTQVGYNCGMRPPVVAGDIAIVIGDGMVGHWTAQTLKKRLANVIVLGRHDDRLSLCSEGIHTINSKQVNIDQALQSLIGEKPVSIVVDTVGDLTTSKQLFPYCDRNSHFVSAGFYGDEGKLDIQLLRNQEITLYAPSGWTTDRMNETLTGIHEQWLETSKLISHYYSVDDSSAAWDLINDSSQNKLGVILKW